MDKISRYDIIVSDIDNTLIYGWMTNLMDLTWDIFKSPKLARFLGYLQYRLRLYKVNDNVRDLLINSGKYIYFLTARGHTSYLSKLIDSIIPPWVNYELIELGSYNPSGDKYKWIFNNLYCVYNTLFIDDSKSNRDSCKAIAKVISPEVLE